LTKWLIGSAAVAGTAVVTTIAVVNSAETPKKDAPVKTQTSPVASQQQQEMAVPQAEDLQAGTPQTQRSLDSWDIVATATSIRPQCFPFPIAEDGTPILEAPGSATTLPKNTQTTVTDPVYAGQTIPEKPVVVQTTEGEDEPVSNNAETPEKNYEPAKIEFPNIFTPNGDGENDKYKLIVHDNIKSIDIVITDTENKVVYRSSDPAFEWDGTYNGSGEPVPDGLYACSVYFKDNGDKRDKLIHLLEVKRRK